MKTAPLPSDAWDLRRAAAFLGVSPRTLERWAARRAVGGLIVYDEPARGEGKKPMLAFDPEALAEWRATHMLGNASRPRATLRTVGSPRRRPAPGGLYPISDE